MSLPERIGDQSILENCWIVKLAGNALEKPGISVSKKKRKPTLYSADPDNPTRIRRETADGKVSVGRLVGRTFKVDD